MRIELKANRKALLSALTCAFYPNFDGVYHATISNDEICFFMPHPPIFGYNAPVKITIREDSEIKISSENYQRLLHLCAASIADTVTVSFDGDSMGFSVSWRNGKFD